MAEPRTLYRVSLLIYRTVGRQLLLLLEETLDLSALLHSFPFFPSTFSLPRRSSSSPSLSPPRWMQENVTVTTRVNFFFFFSSLFIFIFVFPQDSRTCKSYEQSIRSKEGKGTRWRGDSSTSWERSSRGRITAVLSRLLPRCKEPRLCIRDAQWISTTHVITIIELTRPSSSRFVLFSTNLELLIEEEDAVSITFLRRFYRTLYKQSA